MLNGLIKEEKFTKVVMIEPDVLKCTNEDGDVNIYSLGKEAIDFLYGRMDIPFNMCKKLFDTDPSLWENLMQSRLYENHNVKGLSKYRYMTIHNSLIFAMFEPEYDDITEKFDEFDKAFANSLVTINKGGVIQIISYMPMETGKAVLLVDIDTIHGTYVAYNGIETDAYLVTMTNPVIDSERFFEFMTSFDPVEEKLMAIKFYPNILRLFADESIADVKISVREVIDYLKKAKCTLTLNKEKNLATTSLVGSEKLVSFINSFKMPYKSLVKLETLRKSLTYGDFTILEMLEVLTKNYKLSDNLINATMIAEFVSTYLTQTTDRNITDECVPGIK